MSGVREPPVSSPDDRQLVESAVSLAQRAGVSKLDVRDVRWKSWVLIGKRARSIPSDWVFFQRHSLIMPVQLLGSLSVEEWRPLIASSIVYEKQVKRSLWPETMLITTLPIILLILDFAAAYLLQLPLILFLYFAFIIPVTTLGARIYNHSVRAARLRADSISTELSDRLVLISVLRKIEAMNLPDVKSRESGGRIRGLHSIPSISHRIENLQGYPTRPNTSNK